METFSIFSDEDIIALNNENELDEYTYSVAGSVGEFWTHMVLDHQFEVDNEIRDELI